MALTTEGGLIIQWDNLGIELNSIWTAWFVLLLHPRNPLIPQIILQICILKSVSPDLSLWNFSFLYHICQPCLVIFQSLWGKVQCAAVEETGSFQLLLCGSANIAYFAKINKKYPNPACWTFFCVSQGKKTPHPSCSLSFHPSPTHPCPKLIMTGR